MKRMMFERKIAAITGGVYGSANSRAESCQMQGAGSCIIDKMPEDCIAGDRSDKAVLEGPSRLFLPFV